MAFCAYCGTQVAEVSYRPCPTCGNPTNGAPRPAAPTGGTNAAAIIIAVIIGGLFVVAIIGILAAIAIPNFMTAIERSKQKRTMADIRSIATAVESFATENNRYPRVDDLDAIEPLLVPRYMASVPKADGWGTPMRYGCLEETDPCRTYFIGSAGKDKAFERGSLTEYPPGQTTKFDCDIVFSNGNFVQYPEGVQQR